MGTKDKINIAAAFRACYSKNMFLFLRLILAHFIGDFPLQIDEISRQKREGIRGHILHGLVVCLSYIVFALPFLNQPWLLFLIAFFSFTHVFLDWLKPKLDRRNPPNFWLFCLDQCLHIGILSLVLFFDYSWRVPVIPDNMLGYLYGSNRVIATVIAYFIATFAGTYLLYAFTNTCLARFCPDKVPNSLNYGLLERAMIMTIFCFCAPIFYPLVVLLLFVRKIWPEKHRVYQWLLNSLYAAVIGLALRALLA